MFMFYGSIFNISECLSHFNFSIVRHNTKPIVSDVKDDWHVFC